MSSIEMIKGYISEAKDRIRAADERFTNAEEEYMKAKDERTNANHALYYLNIDLQKAESEVITSAPITDKELKARCMEPLTATEDALKLKELEGRFPGGVFVLSSPKTQFEISYKHVDDTFDKIYYAKIDTSFFNFSDFCGTMKTQLMVEWCGLYIDLSHLF